MNITQYKQRLKEFLPTKDINALVKKTRSQRKWNEKHFENKYVERVLYNIINTYEKTHKASM
jgi:hypothetical protein